jgi:hypothetical protein
LPLDRQSIEKRDFPIGRRGYEPEAVDGHLSQLANEVDTLRRQAERRSPESLAAVASQQVAAIVQAAETTAADLERDARDEADRIRQDADRDAASTRDEAVKRSQAHVQRVSEATSQMLQRVDAMQSEVNTMSDALRTGGNRLQADLSLLESSMHELYDTGGRSASTDAVASDARLREVPAPTPPPVAPPEPVAEAPAPPVEQEPAPPPPPPPAAAPPPPPPPAAARDDDDLEGARLIALNMALNGTSRDETDRYLAENFDLSDRSALLDEVYESVEG